MLPYPVDSQENFIVVWVPLACISEVWPMCY